MPLSSRCHSGYSNGVFCRRQLSRGFRIRQVRYAATHWRSWLQSIGALGSTFQFHQQLNQIERNSAQDPSRRTGAGDRASAGELADHVFNGTIASVDAVSIWRAFSSLPQAATSPRFSTVFRFRMCAAVFSSPGHCDQPRTLDALLPPPCRLPPEEFAVRNADNRSPALRPASSTSTACTSSRAPCFSADHGRFTHVRQFAHSARAPHLPGIDVQPVRRDDHFFLTPQNAEPAFGVESADITGVQKAFFIAQIGFWLSEIAGRNVVAFRSRTSPSGATRKILYARDRLYPQSPLRASQTDDSAWRQAQSR